MSAVRELLLPLALLVLQASPEVKVENSTRSMVESDAEASVETARCSVRKTHLELQVCNSRPMRTSLCHGVCVELDSDTEAVANKVFKLGCISCKMRGEVPAIAYVDWYFMATDETDFTQIYNYRNNITDPRFYNRLTWAGSTNTLDLQDGSISIHNVTFNDTGTYKCTFIRILMYPNHKHQTSTSKFINMNVVPQLTRGMASILSEVMMYVSIIGLQLWLVVEMIYCYRKIAAAGEEALRESAAEYLAIASESKDNCAGEQVAE